MSAGLVLISRRFVFQQQHTFLEFIQGGLELAFTCAIDFTGSNGLVLVRHFHFDLVIIRKSEPAHFPSLYERISTKSVHSSTSHHCPLIHNDVAQAISSVGAIVEEYDS